MKTLKAAFYTLGCKLNQFESEAIADKLKGKGVEIVPFSDKADIFIINTCTVTSKSEQKARRVIRKVSRENPGSTIIVTGCYVQLNQEDVDSLAENLITIRQEDKESIINFAEQYLGKNPDIEGFRESLLDHDEKEFNGKFYFVNSDYSFHSRAFLKIQDGCNNFCHYCRVPLARGRSVSLDHEKVIENIRQIEDEGYNEVVLTGVNVTAYKSGIYDFPLLVHLILERTDSIKIRLSSLEPDMVDVRYRDIVKSSRICGHFHLPVQSGSDAVLKAMGRKYKSDKVTEAVEILRSSGKDPFISADIITGFPGETDEDFKDSFNILKNNNFASMHVFPFSRRPGTKAYNMKNLVPERISGERAEKLRNLSDSLFSEYTERWEGKEAEAIIEGEEVISGRLYLKGLSDNYLKIIFPFDKSEDKKYDGKKAFILLGKEGSIKEGFFSSDLITLYK